AGLHGPPLPRRAPGDGPRAGERRGVQGSRTAHWRGPRLRGDPLHARRVNRGGRTMKWVGWRVQAALLAFLLGGAAEARQSTTAALDGMFNEARRNLLAGKPREALPQFQTSLEAHRRALGPTAWKVGLHHHNIAMCHRDLQEWTKGIEACAR